VVVPFGVGRNPWEPLAARVGDLLCDAGFTLRGQIVWDKGTSGGRTTWGSFRLPTDPSLRDTTEAIVEASKMVAADKEVWAIPYDFEGACEEASAVCLGVPYFNWGPSYLTYLTAAMNGEFAPTFEWIGPDWTDINNPDTSMIGFKEGQALSAEAKTNLDKFIAELAGGLQLFAGPLNLQDGTEYLADGVKATDLQIWYLPQLLEGMEGQSVPAN
jgi:simple sugar transport system substrate-binding protein